MIVNRRDPFRPGYVCVTGLTGITEARVNPAFRRILNQAWLNLPDTPLAWLGRAQGHAAAAGVTGAALLEAVCDAGRGRGLTHYFYGGGPGVAETLRDRMVARFPGIQVAGLFTPPFRPLDPVEARVLREDVARARPDVIWVGLSTPKQERFMAEFAPELEAGLLVGVGSAFDLQAGLRRPAPRWMRRNRLEWLFHLAGQPSRLGPKLRAQLLFAARLFLQATRLRRYPLD
jgi:N-acetylglucosaminyldiphosphoundecaprenol N-acetyl-beta-D-mannosaminyltransferase